MSFEKSIRRFQKEWKQGKYKNSVRTVSLCVATGCVVALGSYFLQNRKSEKEIDDLRAIRQEAQTGAGEDREPLNVADRTVLNQYQDLFLQNPDLIGWLTIDGTKIDYPVMWTPEDPEYYSHRGFDKQDSQNGLLFLDEKSNINEYCGNLIIYGHNMKNGSMFADLLKYAKESFWEEHKEIQFDTLYESRIYEIVAVAQENDVAELPFEFTNADAETGTAALEKMSDNALYDTGIDMRYGDDFLTLSTCDYSEDNGRLVVMARRIQ